MLSLKKVLVLALAGFFIVSCTSTQNDLEIITVSGPIPISEMDTTLIHEHVMVDWIGADSTGSVGPR